MVASLGNMGQTSEIDRPQTAKDGSDVGLDGSILGEYGSDVGDR